MSNVGKWDERHLPIMDHPVIYGDAITCLIASAFLADVSEVEDWGCGGGGFRDFCISQKYTGIDGTKTPFVDKIADLAKYTSKSPGIHMRHVIEHNHDWREILTNAVHSFTQKFCLVLFTPFGEVTRAIGHNKKFGVDVPDISFRREDIEDYFKGCNWKLIEGLQTRSMYGVESVYFVWRA